MNPLNEYLRELAEIGAVGVQETSGYGALEQFLNAAGRDLKPAVRCVLHPQNSGAGIPDGGLFTRDQLQMLGRDFEPQNALQMNPARGAVEVKALSASLDQLLASAQVQTYLDRYGKVLCTNYREFAVVEQRNGQRKVLERYVLADNEHEFRKLAKNSVAAAKHSERLLAFLQRALLYGAPLNSPETVAAFMASCAREAKARLELHELPALDRVREAMERALNLNFQTAKADEFFRSSLVQTLFYGVFSAWVLWGREHPATSKASFDWRLASHYIKVPVLRSLFYELANPQNMESLGLDEPLSWVGEALTNVDRAAFDERFKDGSAVQYFYEPFLAAFDPELRKQLGVWYTPPEVVRYMVARVDTLLREELNLPDGLADENVVLLDPCCGTGGFLVEVIHSIHDTLQAKGDDALLATDLKKAVLERLYGFEILTAPFVVAHLQLGLLLQSLGAPLGGDERAPIFLTNALTGWSEPDGEQLKIDLPGLQQEREAADKVKQEKKILVILGNPPYDGYAGIAMGEERDLSHAYRSTHDAALPRPEGQGLNELYVRFFRMAERKIIEDSGAGVVCYISNYSWLEGKSHPGMREAYARRFSRIWIDNLHGDRKISEYAPDGRTSETVFAMRGSNAGIRVGTAIVSLVRKEKHDGDTVIRYRDFAEANAADRRAALLESLNEPEPNAAYQILKPEVSLGLPFKPATLSPEYSSWPRLPELFPVSFPGVKTSRDEFLTDIEKENLVARMEKYFDAAVSDEAIRVLAPSVMTSTQQFDAVSTRKQLVARGFLRENVVRFAYRPFEVRWLYWEPETKLLDRNRAEYWPHVFDGNLAMITQGRARRAASPAQSVSAIGCLDLLDRGANLFPLYLRDRTTAASASTQSGLAFDETPQQKIKPNLSPAAQEYLQAGGGEAAQLFHHALAMQHAPQYRAQNADALRLDWPRIPLPASAEVLTASAELGQQVAALLDVLSPVAGVTAGTIREELRILASVRRDDGAQISNENDLRLEAGWGYRNPSGAVMPGTGKTIARDWTPQERAALLQGAGTLGLDEAALLFHLGENCFDVRLSDDVFWSGVPSRVWEYSLGGYRVLKKWLSYREEKVLGRPLSTMEAREFSAIARRVAALLLLEPQLDANYAATIAATFM